MMTITEAVLLPVTFVIGALLGAIRTARVMRTLHAHDVANCNDCMDIDDESPVAPV